MQIPAPVSRVLPGDLMHDFPLASLVLANLVTIVLAILGNWDAATVMFIYWAQSIVIGVFTVASLLDGDTALLARELQKPIDERGGTDRITTRFAWCYQCLLAGFFTLHYGLFHWGYYSFIVESGIFGTVNFADPGLWLSCGLFSANHLYSYLSFRGRGPRGSGYLTGQFFSPYARIIPMHLTIIFGAILLLVLQALGIMTTLPVLVLFLLLKTRMDISAHLRKHEREKNPDAPVQFF